MLASLSASALKLQQSSPSAEVALAQMEVSVTQAPRCLCFQYADNDAANSNGVTPLIKNGGALTLPDDDGKCEE